MSTYYLDTSAVVKIYAPEQGSAWTRGLTDPTLRYALYTAQLTGPELIAALFRKVRMQTMRQAVAQRTANNIRQVWLQEFRILPLTQAIVDQAMLLAEQYPVRGYDAVHLAFALDLYQLRQAQQLPALTFLSADLEQLAVAAALGLPTDNPAAHP